MARESFVLAFTVVVVALFSLIGVVTEPLYSLSPNWGVALTRFYIALPFILFLVAFIIFAWRKVQGIDEEKDKQLVKALKEAFKQALKEDRVEGRDDTKKTTDDNPPSKK